MRVPEFLNSGSTQRDESLQATVFWGELLKTSAMGQSAPLICVFSGYHGEAQESTVLGLTEACEGAAHLRLHPHCCNG